MEKKLTDAKWIRLVQLGAILFLTTVLYRQVGRFEFVLDDVMVISENNFVRKGFEGIPEILSSDAMTGYIGKQPQLLEGGRYRPLSLVFFAVAYEFFGLDPAGYHWMNLVFYLIAGVLLYFLLSLLFQKEKNRIQLWITGIALLLFMIHPVHTEVVCNIKGADEVLALLFGVAGWIVALKWTEKPSFLRLFTVWIFLFLAFMSKESSLPLVVAIPLSFCYFRKIPVQKAGWFTLLLAVPVLVYFLFRHNALGFLFSGPVQPTGIMNNPYIQAGFVEKYTTILFTVLIYLKLIFFPYPLTHDYYPWQIPLQTLASPWVWLSLIATGGLLLLAVKGWEKRKSWSFAILFFFITLSIVSNAVVNVGTLLNERFLFIPSMALPILTVWYLREFAISGTRVKKILTVALPVIGILFFIWRTMQRIPDWENTMTLNKSAVKVSKNSARANLFYGVALFNELLKQNDDSLKMEMLREAKIYNDRSLKIYPAYADALKMKTGYAAEIWKTDKNLPALLKEFEEAMAVRPVAFVEEFTNWLLPRADRALLVPFFYRVGYENLASKQKNYSEALKYLNKGYQLDNRDPYILFGLCIISYLAGNDRDAVGFGEQYLLHHGKNAEVLYYTGKALIRQKIGDKGLNYLEQAYQLQPELKNRL